MPKLELLPSALSELFVSASHLGYLTLSDRYGLMAALLEESLSEEEQSVINRLLHAVRRGQICIVNKIYTVSLLDA